METYDALCEDDKHCYHSDNIALMTHPPQYRHTCCHCGHQILIRGWEPPDHRKQK